MKKTIRHYLAPYSWLLLFVAVSLGLALLAGCRAEDGVEGGVGGAIDGTVSWADVDAILTTTCAACHPGTGTDLAYAAITANNSGTCGSSAAMVTAGDKSLSCLYLAAAGLEGDNMFGTTPYTADAATIGSWIDAGAVGP